LTNQEEKITIWFIINPISGGKSKTRLIKKIERYLDLARFKHSIYKTEYKGHGKEIAQNAVDQQIDLVCAVGGDGTIHEIAGQLIESKTGLCIIAKGSGNGIANHLGIPKKIKKAISIINKGLIAQIDTVAVNDSHFIGTAGFGIDALIAEQFSKDPKRGLKTYIKHSIREFINLKPIKIQIESDRHKQSVQAFMLCIANTSEFGNRFKISPKSSVRDGMLELIIVRPFPKWKGGIIAAKIFSRKAYRSKYIDIISVREGQLELSQEIAHYDGEFITAPSRISFKVLPNSLKVMIPEKKLSKI
jgi:YegS/Rv2252/BmrU family lipid kinase